MGWSAHPKELAAITLFTEDLDASKSFYATVFELPVFYENEDSAVFKFGDVMINLLAISEAPELIAPAVVAPRRGGARQQITVPVDDVDDAAKQLLGRGVALLSGPVDRPWGIRTVTFEDPAGHIWELAQDIS
jgi:lactoylglutathione lyase